MVTLSFTLNDPATVGKNIYNKNPCSSVMEIHWENSHYYTGACPRRLLWWPEKERRKRKQCIAEKHRLLGEYGAGPGSLGQSGLLCGIEVSTFSRLQKLVSTRVSRVPPYWLTMHRPSLAGARTGTDNSDSQGLCGRCAECPVIFANVFSSI